MKIVVVPKIFLIHSHLNANKEIIFLHAKQKRKEINGLIVLSC